VTIPLWVRDFAWHAAVLAALLGLGALRLLSSRRLRVRGRLPTSPALEAWRRRLTLAAAWAAAGALLMLAFLSGGPRAFGWAGAAVGMLGLLALAATGIGLVRERFRLGGSRARVNASI
jgi:hypothetical protein